ncbi:hypothetical protein [Pseudodesulfovibrio methanolicus]|uniref:Co-chaperone DjlA N-terminal domain-containing protein n=1 Tax=Pseudodesulfovibrio methanolicus TaxID=3126690 RepID=A0ABZ2IYQ8_9BACT
MLDTNDLTRTEAKAYLSYLFKVAEADGHIDDKEREYIALQAKLWGVASEELAQPVPLEHLRDISHAAKMSLLRDCITIAHIDGDYAEAEKRRIEDLADFISIPIPKLEELEDWLQDYWKVLERGRILILNA